MTKFFPVECDTARCGDCMHPNFSNLSMATNKNQHFVPRCYLRSFTKNEENVTINLFNIDRAKLIENAAVKHQCSGSYFYGQDDKLEAAIQGSETAYASLLRRIRQPGYELDDADRHSLRFSWALQHLRTEAASQRAVKMAASTDAVLGEELLSFRFGIREAVQIAMQTVVDVSDCVDDLKVCLVKNRTDVPFFTSDDPAVATNRWYLEDRRALGCSFGSSSSGFLAFMPLTPDILFVAYDGDVYTVQHNNGWVETRSPGDVKALNQHQIMNCFANLYVHDAKFEGEVRRQIADCADRRLEAKHRVNYAILDEEGSSHTHSRYRVVEPTDETRQGKAILHMQTLHPHPTRWPAFLRWRAPGVVYTNGTGLNYIRYSHVVTTHSANPFWKERAR
ncbi:DUF4238 domain-containing protein [Burkholderia multivorans]|nr:DUF4238 domain-containing protein [Burkholderia multivorans]